MRLLKEEKGQTETSMLILIGGAVVAALVVGVMIKTMVVEQIQPEVQART